MRPVLVIAESHFLGRKLVNLVKDQVGMPCIQTVWQEALCGEISEGAYSAIIVDSDANDWRGFQIAQKVLATSMLPVLLLIPREDEKAFIVASALCGCTPIRKPSNLCSSSLARLLKETEGMLMYHRERAA